MGLFKNKEIKQIEVKEKIEFYIPECNLMFGGTDMTNDE